MAQDLYEFFDYIQGISLLCPRRGVGYQVTTQALVWAAAMDEEIWLMLACPCGQEHCLRLGGRPSAWR